MKKISPCFKDNYVPVVLASSTEYTKYLAVTVQSIILCKKKVYNLDVVILHNSIPETIQNTFIANFRTESVSIRFYEVSEDVSDCNYSVRSGYKNESFYRVLISELMADYEKVVYLDCDVIVCEDIAKLHSTNNDSRKCVAAVRDINGISASVINYENRKQYMRDFLGLNEFYDYFQSGVMIYYVKEIRARYNIDYIISQSCLDGVMFGDQDVLNKIFSGAVQYLDMKWNVIVDVDRSKFENQYYLAPYGIIEQYTKARNAPGIIHFAGTKPWNEPDCDYAEYFWNIARTTPFYNEIVEEMRHGKENN